MREFVAEYGDNNEVYVTNLTNTNVSLVCKKVDGAWKAHEGIFDGERRILTRKNEYFLPDQVIQSIKELENGDV